MSFWVQHGYGKGDKIDRLVSSNHPPGGVILSPSSEMPGNLAGTAGACIESDVSFLLDPETYVYTIPGADGKKHVEHGLEFGELSWSDSPRRLAEVVDGIVEVNQILGTSGVISPSPYQSTFGDVWAPMPLQMARATMEATSLPVYASIVVSSAAFAEWRQVERWLDAFTTIGASGVYLIVAWEGGSYPNTWDAQLLRNVFRLVYQLTVLNRYELIWGYSDIAGVVGLACGAHGVGSGWYQSLRLWTSQKWLPRSGGRQSQPRVLSGPMMSPLRASGEGDVIAASPLASDVFPDPSIRRALASGAWSLNDSWYQHMLGLSELCDDLNDLSTDPEERLEPTLGLIDDALRLIRALADEGVVLERVHQARLDALAWALRSFAEDEDLI